MTLHPITLTGHAQKEAWRDKVLPPVEHLGAGVWSIPVPFPDNPMRYTLSYLLMGDGDAVVIDPGWDSDDGLDHLAAGLRQAGLGLTDLTGIVATHFHSDHLGMAARLRTATGAWVALGEKEVRRLSACDDPDAVLRSDREELTLWGVPADRLPEVALDRPRLAHLQDLADPDLRLTDGALVPAKGLDLRVVTTPGAFTGAYLPGRRAARPDLQRGPCPAAHLPAHRPGAARTGKPAGGLLPVAGPDRVRGRDGGLPRARVPVCRHAAPGRALVEHNRERSAEVLRVLEAHRPETVWDIARHLTWSRGWDSLQAFSLRLAVSETASHVVYLRSQGHDIGVPVTEPRPVGTEDGRRFWDSVKP